MRYLIFLLFLLCSATAPAQMLRTIYQTFEVDSTKTIRLDLVGFTQIEVRAWAGNSVMTEVNIALHEASPEILNYFVDQGRYKFASEAKTDEVNIFTQIRERKVIKTKISGHKGCQEEVSLRIFVPDTYNWSNTLEGDSDGLIVTSEKGYLLWQSRQKDTNEVEDFEASKKHKLVKTLLLTE